MQGATLGGVRANQTFFVGGGILVASVALLKWYNERQRLQRYKIAKEKGIGKMNWKAFAL